MVQHLLLLMVAPALIWLGAPFFPLLRGVPATIRTHWVGPVLRARVVRRFFGGLTHPFVALPLFIAAIWIWHAPGPYDWALRSDARHYLEHCDLFGCGAVVLVPGGATLSQPAELVAVAVDAVPDSGRRAKHAALGAPHLRESPPLSLLHGDPAPGGRVAACRPGRSRRHHVGAGLGRLFGSALRDRRAAAVLLPGASYCRADRRRARARAAPRFQHSSSPCSSLPPAGGFDLLHVPLVGRFLKWRHARHRLAVATRCAGGSSDCRRTSRTAAGSHEPGRRPALDSLARLADPGPARRGQLLLHGLSLHAAAATGRPLAGFRPGLAALAADEVVVARVRGPVSLGLRGLRALGQSAVDGLDRRQLFRCGVCRRRVLSCRHVLQVRLSDRPVQFCAVAGFAAAGQSPLARSLRLVPHARVHPRQRRRSRLPDCGSFNRTSRATWTARFVSTACTPARTTTSA